MARQAKSFARGFGLVEEREARLQALRDTIGAAMTKGGAHDDEAASDVVAARLDGWEGSRKMR